MTYDHKCFVIRIILELLILDKHLGLELKFGETFML